ncbi:AAA family ATPase [Micromonospora sp. LOL_021]|uniref:AAA family ATPase n=1 Tax=Micromonospora sp. LOL_021 TaxID=3345417 RepID=UPI003A8C0DE6
MADGVRYGLLVRTCLEVLRDSGQRLHGRDVLDQVAERIDLNEAEMRPHRNGSPAWAVAARFYAGDAATIGWLIKRDALWWITDDGLAALDMFPDPDTLLSEINKRYNGIVRDRKAARKKYDDRLEKITSTLELVPAGSWTAYDDLAELVDGTPDDIAHLLADTYVDNAHRVLNASGRVPDARHQHARLRGSDLAARLSEEGVEFVDGRANAEQRITADFLAERLAETATLAAEPVARRAWLVRGSNVDGADLVPQWLAEGWVSLAASQLPQLGPGIDEQQLTQAVADAYRHKSYSVREKLTGEFNAFLRLMRDGDFVATAHHGDVHLGLVTGPPSFTGAGELPSHLRRPVRWLELDPPVDLSALPAALSNLLQSQDDVVDLTDGLAALEHLAAPLLREPAPTAAPATPATPPPGPVATPTPTPPPAAEARLGDVPADLADTLLLDLDWLRELRELLARRRQIILYGPPGTGKTYVARALAARLTEPHAVRLIQFHPSYTYEDFFEGFRPEAGDDGTLRFKLTSGPLRRLADAAREHPSTAYVLIIDEINRGNLAKVFGELYFLLEYRDQPIALQYSAKDFTLPANLYLIGTMNTADRSIAQIDVAMRRRFAFVEMHPDRPPVAGLLHRWLTARDLPTEAADLLDALNARLADADYAVGPTYLLDEADHRDPDGLDRVWRHDILPLLADHHYADDLDVPDRYGLDALRTALADRQPAP